MLRLGKLEIIFYHLEKPLVPEVFQTGLPGGEGGIGLELAVDVEVLLGEGDEAIDHLCVHVCEEGLAWGDLVKLA